MKGSVTKYTVTGSSRPRWRYRIYAGKDEAGNKLYEGRGGFEKEGTAGDAMRDHIAEIQARQAAALAPIAPPPPAEKTLGEWLQGWLDTYAVAKCQPKTLERYRSLAAYLQTRERPQTLPQPSFRRSRPRNSIPRFTFCYRRRRNGVNTSQPGPSATLPGS